MRDALWQRLPSVYDLIALTGQRLLAEAQEAAPVIRQIGTRIRSTPRHLRMELSRPLASRVCFDPLMAAGVAIDANLAAPALQAERRP